MNGRETNESVTETAASRALLASGDWRASLRGMIGSVSFSSLSGKQPQAVGSRQPPVHRPE